MAGEIIGREVPSNCHFEEQRPDLPQLGGRCMVSLFLLCLFLNLRLVRVRVMSSAKFYYHMHSRTFSSPARPIPEPVRRSQCVVLVHVMMKLLATSCGGGTVARAGYLLVGLAQSYGAYRWNLRFPFGEKWDSKNVNCESPLF